MSHIEHHLAPEGMTPGNGYSHAVSASGRLVAIAGQVAMDEHGELVGPDDPVAQTERVLANLEAVLRAAGCQWRSVVKTTVFLQNMADFPRVNEAYARVLGDARPARSTVQVAGLPKGVLVEIEAIARVG